MRIKALYQQPRGTVGDRKKWQHTMDAALVNEIQRRGLQHLRLACNLEKESQVQDSFPFQNIDSRSSSRSENCKHDQWSATTCLLFR